MHSSPLRNFLAVSHAPQIRWSCARQPTITSTKPNHNALFKTSYLRHLSQGQYLSRLSNYQEEINCGNFGILKCLYNCDTQHFVKRVHTPSLSDLLLC